MTTCTSPVDPPTAPLTPARIAVSVLHRGRASVDPQRNLVVSDRVSLETVAQRIRTSTDLIARTTELRTVLAEEGRGVRYKRLKQLMPAIIPAASAPAGTFVKGLPPSQFHTCLYGYDIDEGRERLALPELRALLIGTPGMTMVGVSCAGDALYAVVAGPLATTDAQYKIIWTWIKDQLPAMAQAASSGSSKNFNRLRFLCHDPDVWLGESVAPLRDAPEPESPPSSGSSKRQRRASGRGDEVGDETAQDEARIDRDALRHIHCPRATDDGDGYNRFLSWMVTLKTLGFSPHEVTEWCASGHARSCGDLSEVSSRWDGLPEDAFQEARDKLRGAAYNLGWRHPDIHGRTRNSKGTPSGSHTSPGDTDNHKSSAIMPYVKACYNNCTDASASARFFRDHASRLVVALPDIDDPHNTPADIYAVTRTGMLSQTAADALLLETGRAYLGECLDLKPRELAYVATHARSLRNSKAMDKIRSIAAAVIMELEVAGALPDGLVIKPRADIDASLLHVGTPQGVLDLLTGHLVPHADARDLFIVSSIPDNWDPEARHPKLDRILPPVGEMEPKSPAEYRARILGHTLTHAPRRELMWEVCDEGAGKSVFVNAIGRGLGDCYIRPVRREAIQPTTHASGATSHNGDIRHFGKPSRICFVMEMASKFDGELVKGLSGGDRVPIPRHSG